MCAYDYDNSYPEFYSTCVVKAKKEHKCSECRRYINSKENYEKVVGKWDGDFLTYKTCSHCMVAMKLLQRECGGYLYTGVLEDIEEHIGNDYPWERDARRLAAGMRKGWKLNGNLVNIPVLKT